MPKTKMNLKQRQHATGELCANVCGFKDGDHEIAKNAITQRLATLYGRAPKKFEQTAKGDSHNDKFQVDWGLIKATIGTSEQTLNESEMFLLRALCDFADLTVLGVCDAELSSEWEANTKLANKVGQDAVNAARTPETPKS